MTVQDDIALVEAHCPVCARTLAAPFYDGGQQTLATLGWPGSAAEAQTMPRYPQNFVQCPACTHVWNRSFRYEAIPYQKNPNRMFNQGSIWKGHLARIRDALLGYLPKAPRSSRLAAATAISCADSPKHAAARGALRVLTLMPAGRQFGAGVPCSPVRTSGGHGRLRPRRNRRRHVLEHLTAPAELLEQLAWGARPSTNRATCLLKFRASTGYSIGPNCGFLLRARLPFTNRVFSHADAAAGDLTLLAHGYNGEVVYALVKLGYRSPRRSGRGVHTRSRAAQREPG